MGRRGGDSAVHTRTISERSASGLGGGSLFNMDGLSYRLEVCLDHRNKRLLNNAPVRVQLVPSCGRSIVPAARKLVGNVLFSTSMAILPRIRRPGSPTETTSSAPKLRSYPLCPNSLRSLKPTAASWSTTTSFCRPLPRQDRFQQGGTSTKGKPTSRPLLSGGIILPSTAVQTAAPGAFP